MIYLFLSIAMACPTDLIICRTVCTQDGYEKGVMIGPDCYCANKRDIKKVVFKINRDFRGDINIDQKNRWDEE